MASRNVETYIAAHQAFNKRDFDAVVATAAEGITYQEYARNLTFRGRTGFREFIQSWATTFSNAEIFDAKYVDAGDVVIAEFAARGVNDGSLGPLPATGKEATFRFCEIMRFNAEGQIAAGAAYYDQLSIMVQLGHAKPPQAASAGV